jgi:hypothetical protein
LNRYFCVETIKLITDKKPISVKELVKNPIHYNNDDVLVLGKVFSYGNGYIYKFEKFSIVDNEDYSRVNVSLSDYNKLNFRQGTIENLNTFSKFILTFFHFILNFRTVNDKHLLNEPFLIDDDEISIFGKYSNNWIKPSIICQGNKQNLIENFTKECKRLAEMETLLNGLIIVSAIREGILYINDIIIKWRNRKYNKLSEKRNQNISENCSKCKNSYVNVVQLDCNHFSFCFRCFQLLNYICPLCNTEVHNFYVLKDK